MDSVVVFILIFIPLTLAQPLGHVRAQTEPSPVQARWLVEQAPEGGWTVGDRIPLRLSVSYPAGFEVSLPRLPDNWGPFEVQTQELLEPVQDQDGTSTAVSQIIVSLWAPGLFGTPPVTIRYRDEGGHAHEIEAPSLSVSVVSVLEEGETEKADLKPQAALPEPRWLPWVVGALLLLVLGAAAGWAGYRRFGQRPRSGADRSLVSDPRPPHEIAYSELERIEALDLPARDELKMHYSLVAGCVRTYVQGRYHIDAPDLTTEELDAAMRQRRVETPHAAAIRDFLAQADLVKFAKFRPHIEQAYGAIASAKLIVDITTPAQPAHQSDETALVARDPEAAFMREVGRDAETGPTHREPLDH